MDETRQIELPDGTVVWARVAAPPDEDDLLGLPSEVGARDVARRAAETAAERLGHMTETIKGVAASVQQATRGLAPDEVRVEFGLELSGEPGHLVALLASGETRMTFKVALTWRSGRDAPLGSDDEASEGSEASGAGPAA